MAVEIIIEPGAIADLSGAAFYWSDVERAVWPLFRPYRENKRALWVEAAAPSLYRGGGVADPPGAFRILDRVGGRIFTPEKIRNRHPIVMKDSVTGKPVMMFGAGGAGTPNALDSTFNGVLECAPILEGGVEVNDLPLFYPDTGYSVCAKIIVPPPNITFNGLPFTTVGGPILGSGSPTNSMAIIVEGSVGRARAFNDVSVNANNQYYEFPFDLRDAQAHTLTFTYNDATGTYRHWRDGNEMAAVSGCTTDISTGAGASRPAIGGFGLTATGPQGRFCGGIFALMVLPGPVLEQAAARDKVHALMATR